MIITLKDGSTKEYAQPMSVYEIAKDISEGLARVATAGELDGEVVDLRTVVDKDSHLNILTFDDEKGAGAIPSYDLSHYGTGNQASVSEYQISDRTVNCGRILL